MSKSTASSNSIEKENAPGTTSTGSADGDTLPKAESMKELSEIMMRSQILQLQMEGSLNNALEQVSAIMKEKDDLDWEFLN